MSTRDSQNTSTPPIPLGGIWLIVTALTIGISVATYLVWIKLRLEFDPSYISSCNFSEKLNCDAVQTSEYATVFGFPLALYGVATYIFFALLAIIGTAWKKTGAGFHALIAFASLAGCIHSLYLAYISSVVIGAYCIFCMAMYAVNLFVAGISSFYVFRGGGRGALQNLLKRPRSLGDAAIIYALLLGLAFPAYTYFRGVIRDQRMSQVREEIAERNQLAAQLKQAPSSEQLDNTQKTTKEGTTQVSKGQQNPTNDMLKKRGELIYSETITRKGRSYLKMPVGPNDFALGPDDAPVTVVEFADFECGYCRMLNQNLKPLKKKYEGKVRWVFKHFPLNNSCNKVMKGTQHPRACAAARAADCAGHQGLFWPMHDQLFANPHKLTDQDLRKHAKSVGADPEKWDLCMKGPDVDKKITADTMLGRFARISGTPRMYINGHLVPGVHATEVLDYYLKAAMDAPPTPAIKNAQPSLSSSMVKASTAEADFYIDRYEASINKEGSAMSKVGVYPAQTSWFESNTACEKAGKRLCTEEEWISACTGSPAVDNNGNKIFSDDAVEGRMFPYGFFHEGRRCHDNEPKQGGTAKSTGAFPDCRTPSGIFDLSGNLAEWTGANEEEAAVTGSYFSYGQKASCMGRQTRFGPGYRNHTTGFRCCSDEEVQSEESAVITHGGFARNGTSFPAIRVDDGKGGFITEADVKGSVYIVAFFASWCGPCRKELPAFNELFLKHRDKGLKVLAIGVDTDKQKALDFARSMELDYRVGFDPQAISMGACAIKGMPTALLVDAQGIIQARLEGINTAKTEAFVRQAEALLKP